MFDVFNKIRKNNNILNIYIIFNILWVFLGIFMYNYLGFSYRSYSTSYIVIFLINIIFVFVFSFKNNIKFGLIDLFLVLLIIFGIISCIFSKNISVSLYGYWLRYEGLFQLLYYYSLFYLCSLISKNKNIILYFIIGFGVVNALVSIIQVMDILKFIPIRSRGTSLAHGLITNSNFLGSYMTICLGLSLGLFINSLNCFKKNIVFYVLFIVFYSSLLVSSALSGVVGFIFSLLFLVCLFIYKIYNKRVDKCLIIKYILVLCGIIFITIILSCSKKSLIVKDLLRFERETKEIVKGNVSDSYGSSRMFIWRNTLEIVPENLVHGVGIDCFTFAFDGDMLYSKNKNGLIIYYDKVHNEYLQKLVCEGIFSCLIYIGLLFILFLKSVKCFFEDSNNIIVPMFLSFVGYSVQAFFNISVLEVAPLYFMICGLMYNRSKKRVE